MMTLKQKHYTTSQALCDFVNQEKVTVVSICATGVGGCFTYTLFYKERG